MRLRTWLRFSLLTLFILGGALATGCPSDPVGSDGGMDGGDADTGVVRDGAVIREPDGRVTVGGTEVTDRETEECGAGGQSCCRGDRCNTGLVCDDSDNQCCSRAGVGRCDTAADCCSGLTCNGGLCGIAEGSRCDPADPLVCSGGLVCLDGECTDPPGGCGATGGECCMEAGGGGVCRAGNVCGADGATCEACGTVGQPCCPGAGGGCPESSDSLCITGMCQIPDGCGVPGMPCCEDATDPCIRSAQCGESGMCEERPGAGEPGSGCGGDGEPCCLGGECQFGSICESFLTNICVGIGTISDILGLECGTAGNLCCLPSFTCEGNLQCDLLFCSGDCTTQGDTCTDDSECCDSASCALSPNTKTCCKGADSACFNDSDCCGFMSCDGRGDAGVGLCACQTMGEECASDVDCCDDGVCTEGMCRPGPDECTDLGAMCSEDTECCAAFACSPVADSDLEEQCCANKETSCTDATDCCGQMGCTNGECVCQDIGAACGGDGECCGDDTACIVGVCTNTTGCNLIGNSCDMMVATDCCGETRCQQVGNTTDAPFQCCVRDQQVCEDDTECCGTMRCMEGVCQCKATGASCTFGSDCCGGMCTDGTCA